MRHALMALVGIALAHAPADGQVLDRILASVGGRVVTLSDVRAAHDLRLVDVGSGADQTRAVLDRLIDRLLVLDEVERYAPPEPEERVIAQRVEEIRSTFDSPDAFRAAMRASGWSETGLRSWVRNDLRIRAYLEQRFAGVIEPTGEDLENYVREITADLRRTNKPVDEAEVRRLARERAVSVRRQALIREWVDGLRRRATITYTQSANRANQR
jgi:hypothetical protein